MTTTDPTALPDAERDAALAWGRLTRLDPSLTLGEALETLADLGASRQLAVISEDDEGPVLGALGMFRGEATARYIAAIEAVDEDQDRDRARQQAAQAIEVAEALSWARSHYETRDRAAASDAVGERIARLCRNAEEARAGTPSRRDERDALAAWIKEHAEHADDCAVLDLDDEGKHKACSCGLSALLDRHN